jgi:hypothetical protein
MCNIAVAQYTDDVSAAQLPETFSRFEEVYPASLGSKVTFLSIRNSVTAGEISSCLWRNPLAKEHSRRKKLKKNV